MSKPKYSGVGIVDMRGSLGTSTFFKNRGGNAIRTKVTPSLVQNSYTSFVRDNFGILSAQWRTLTEEQRQAWRDATPLWTDNNSLRPNQVLQGNDLFIAINQNLNRIGIAPILMPMPKEEVPIFTATRHFIHLSIKVEFQWSAIPANWYRVFESTPSMSAGISNYYKYLRFIQYDTGGALTNIDYTAVYSARFGGLTPIGERQGFRFKLINSNNGQVSPVKVISILSV